MGDQTGASGFVGFIDAKETVTDHQDLRIRIVLIRLATVGVDHLQTGYRLGGCRFLDLRDLEHPHQITQWKAQLLDGAAGVFGSETRGDSQGPAVDLTVLHAKIGELTLENDFLAGALGKAGLPSAKR
jgi:hypothetical protein